MHNRAPITTIYEKTNEALESEIDHDDEIAAKAASIKLSLNGDVNK